MASSLLLPAPMTTALDESDYGSDLDEATVDALYSHCAGQVTIETPIILDDHGDGEPRVRLARNTVSPALANGFSPEGFWTPPRPPATRTAAIAIEYDKGNRDSFLPGPHETSQSSPPPPAPNADTRAPPLVRFRSHKPLSVTDLVSPAWCELQYFYSLSRFGRVRKTPAMKQGSSVHRALEREVHAEVPVQTTTREERFALRLWNVVYGLRTLRKGGMTRELEVWGVVEGEVVNGVVDQVSFSCPDEGQEEEVMGEGEEGMKLAEGQKTLADYFRSSQTGSILEHTGTPWIGTLQGESKGRQLYLVDVKTRQSKSLPPAGSQTRPTHYQLMLYHRLLSDLAATKVDAESIFARYNLDPSATFTDAFLAQMSQLSEGFEEPLISSTPQQEDPLSELLAHPTLTTLWTLMIREFSLVLPSTTATTISPFLTAEFRSAASGSLIGRKHFRYDAEALDRYVKEVVKWWRGEREARGVEVEEAGKCRICEFAHGCEWRIRKVEEGLRRVKLRKEARERGRAEV